jgi:hypothetical protein
MSGNGMKTFSVPQGMDLFFINDRGEQVINPAALPYLQTPLLNKTDPGSKKRKIDEISDSTVFEKMKQEGDEPMPAYPSHVENDGVICIGKGCRLAESLILQLKYPSKKTLLPAPVSPLELVSPIQSDLFFQFQLLPMPRKKIKHLQLFKKIQ